MKQETLEEFSERLQEEIQYGASKSDIIDNLNKWQQEQNKNLYSEEEVIELLIKCPYVLPSDIKNWFDQFKKK